MIFSYGSRRLRTNAFSFCRAAVLANSEISSIDCRLSFGSLVHWRMIFRRASRCFFITAGIGTLLEVDDSGSAVLLSRAAVNTYWRSVDFRRATPARRGVYCSVYLDRACMFLPTGSDKHRARRIIAAKI